VFGGRPEATAFVLRLSQFINAATLLRKQCSAIDDRLAVCQAFKRIVPLTLRQLRAPNHDFGRYAPYVYASATDNICTLDQRYFSATFNGFGCCRKSAGPRAYDDDMGPVATFIAYCFAIALQQFSVITLI
jgi:hypothetical protein